MLPFTYSLATLQKTSIGNNPFIASPDCDACIWSLIGDMRQSNKTLDLVRNSVLNISTGAAANDRLKYYNYTAHRLQVTTLKIHIKVWELQQRIHSFPVMSCP